MESDSSRIPRKQSLRSSVTEPSITGTEDNSRESDPIFARFRKLEANTTTSTDPEFISSLYHLKDHLQEWRIHRDQKKFIKKISSDRDRNDIEAYLTDLENRSEHEASSSQPNLLQLDRNTFYKNDQIEHREVSDEREAQLVKWLLAPVDFKAIGISGTGDCGKTALVKNVLKQESIQKIFKCIIWASLSQSAGDGEIDMEDDVRIIEYLLYRLGLDTDNLVVDVDDQIYRDWLMEELKHRLRDSGNYILVFDDMRHSIDWFAGDDFLGKLKKNGGGGAVIVTSRIKAVAEKIAQNNMHIHLKPWDDYKENGFMKDEVRDLGTR